MTTDLFREASREELELVTREILGDAVLSFRLLSGGLFNTSYLLETGKNGTAVLRLGPVNRHLLLPYEHFLMESEAEVCRLCALYGIPASEVLAADTSKQVIDRDVMFVRYIPSVSLSEVEDSLEPGEREAIFGDLGRAMRAFNGIEGVRFGRIADVLHGGGSARWSDALGKELCEWESVCRKTDFVPAEQYGRYRTALERARPILDEVKTPRLLHNDLWSGNVLLTRDETGRRRFAAVIDADRALWGDPDMEVFWLGKDAKAFWDAYSAPRSESPESGIRRAFYRMLTHLWAVYIYGLEYQSPDIAVRERKRADEACETVLDGIGKNPKTKS